jgi:uncharacterized membrane protein SpoIIM required for sporulation
VRRLNTDEVLELGRLYRASTSDLAIARRDFSRDVATERLNDLVAGRGVLELSAIFLASGAGLRLAWAILRPGEGSRRDALRLAGAQSTRVVLLVIIALGIAGIIEGFLSPSGAPVVAKVAVGLVTA